MGTLGDRRMMTDDHHRDRPSGFQVPLRHGDQEATVVEVGGALRSYTVGGRPVLDGYDEAAMATAARGQPLVPWPNRLADGRYDHGGRTHQVPLSEPTKGNAIHGLVRFANWELVERRDDTAALVHWLHPQPGYPFLLHLEVRYRLADSGLTVRLRVTNRSDTTAPCALGWHPYLLLGDRGVDPLHLRFAAAERFVTDERGIPTGRVPVAGTRYDFAADRAIGDLALDTAFTGLARDEHGRATVTLTDPDSGECVMLWMGPSFGYGMLFTGDSLSDPAARRRSLGVEPMTAAPNGLASGDGLTVLAPLQSVVASWGVTVGRA